MSHSTYPHRSFARFVVALALALGTGCPPPPPTPESPATAPPAALGTSLTIDSQILGERRRINVYLPPNYDTDSERYPVLYVLDGGMGEDFPHVTGSVDASIKNAVIRPVIVVGIENTVRRRDLVGPTTVAEEQKVAPQAGGADRFRRFLGEELAPFIAHRYRTSDESALIGESLAGLFVIETLLVEPTLFDSYIAVSPSLWWNEQALVSEAGPRLAWWSAGPKTLYLATASDEREGLDALLVALRINAQPGTPSGPPGGLAWVHEPMLDEQHHTIFPRAALRGIRHVFAKSE